MGAPARVATAGLAAIVVAGVVAGCSGGGSGTGAHGSSDGASGSPSVAATPLAAQLAAVDTNLVAQDEYVVTTTSVDPTYGTTVTTTVHQGEDRSVTSTGPAGIGTVDVLEVGGETWVRGGVAYWNLELVYGSGGSGTTAQAAALAGHWVLVTGTRAAALQQETPPLNHPDDTTVQGTATVDGAIVDVYADPVAQTTISVTRTEPRLPVEVKGANGAGAVYSAYGSAPAVAAPPAADVVDGRSLLPT